MKCYFFTGLPCSGKTTLARELCNRIDAVWLDGDEIRKTPITTEGYSKEDREKHILRLGYIAKMFIDRGINVVISCVASDRSVRDLVRSFFNAGEFAEIFVSTPLSECMARDVKGMYKEANEGKRDGFIGIGAEYEPPLKPEHVIDTSLDVKECIDKILDKPIRKQIIFFGRFQPFHLGHKEIIDRELINNDVVVCIKFTQTDENNPYVPDKIKEMIRRVYGDRVSICVVPNFSEIVYGREVGYGMRKVSLEGTLEDISGTRIRGLNECGMNLAKYKLMPEGTEDLI